MQKSGLNENFNAYSIVETISPKIGREISSIKRDLNSIRNTHKENVKLINDNKEDISNLAKRSISETIKEGKIYSSERAKEAEKLGNKALGMDIDLDSFDDMFDDDLEFEMDDIPIGGNPQENSDNDTKDKAESSSFNNMTEDEKEKTLKLFKNTNIVDNTGLDAKQASTISLHIASSVQGLIKINASGFSKVSEAINYTSSLNSNGYSSILGVFSEIDNDFRTVLDNQVVQMETGVKQGATLTDLLLGNFTLTSITSNIASAFDFASMILPAGMSMLSEVVANPASTAMKHAFKYLISKADKNERLKTLNDYVRDIPLTMRRFFEEDGFDNDENFLGKIGGSKIIKKFTKDKTLSEFLLDNLFGGDFNLDGPNVSNRLSKSSKVAFDGESHNTINVVIPGYLMKINEAITGDQVFYNYQRGVWQNKKDSVDNLKTKQSNFSINKNFRLKNLLSNSGIEEPSIKGIMRKIMDNKINDLSSLEENEKEFNTDIFKTLKEAIGENPEQFKKYTILSDLYRSFYSRNKTDISGSELNMYNSEKLKNNDDGPNNEINKFIELRDGISLLSSNIKNFINRQDFNSDSPTATTPTPNNDGGGGSGLVDMISGAGELLDGSIGPDGFSPEAILGNIGNKIFSSSSGSDVSTPQPSNIIDTASSFASTATSLASGGPMNPLAMTEMAGNASKLVSSISDKFNSFFKDNSDQEIPDLSQDLKKSDTKTPEEAIERGLNRQEKEFSEVSDDELKSHGYDDYTTEKNILSIQSLMGGVADGSKKGNFFTNLLDGVKGFIGKGINIGTGLLSFAGSPIGKWFGGTKLGKGLLAAGKTGVGKFLKSGVAQKFMGSKLGSSMISAGTKASPKLMSIGKDLFSGKFISAGKTIFNSGKASSSLFGKATGVMKSVGSKAMNVMRGSKLGGKVIGKAAGALSKVKGIGSLFGKVGGKGIGKLLTKGLGKFSSFIPFIGPALFVATSLPEIMQTIKHPIQALKHPFKTIGSFLGLTEHPGETYENENPGQDHSLLTKAKGIGNSIKGFFGKVFGGNDEKNIDGASEEIEDPFIETSEAENIEEVIDEEIIDFDQLSLAKSAILPSVKPLVSLIETLLGKIVGKYSNSEKDTIAHNELQEDLDHTGIVVKDVLQTLMTFSPFGIFNHLPDSFTNEFMNSDMVNELVRDPKHAARRLFSNTAVGSIYELVDPQSKAFKNNWFTKRFEELFDAMTLKNLMNDDAVGTSSGESVINKDDEDLDLDGEEEDSEASLSGSSDEIPEADSSSTVGSDIDTDEEPKEKSMLDGVYDRVKRKYFNLFGYDLEEDEEDDKPSTSTGSSGPNISNKNKSDSDVELSKNDNVSAKDEDEDSESKGSNKGDTSAASRDVVGEVSSILDFSPAELVQEIKDKYFTSKDDRKTVHIPFTNRPSSPSELVSESSPIQIGEARFLNEQKTIKHLISRKINFKEIDKYTSTTSTQFDNMLDYDFEKYLIMRDLLDLVENIGVNVDGIVDQLDDMLDELNITTQKIEFANDIKDKSNNIIENLTLETDNIDFDDFTSSNNDGFIRNILPI